MLQLDQKFTSPMQTDSRMSQLVTVDKISARLRDAHKLDEMLPILADEMLQAIDAAAVTIWLYDSASNELRQVAGSGFPNLNTRLKPGEGIAGQVFASDQPYVSSEFKTDPRTHESARARIPAGLGGAAVPIHASNQTIGVLFASVLWPRAFDEDQLRLLKIISEIAGMGIHRAHLCELNDRRLAHLSALQTINLAMTSHMDYRSVLNAILYQITTQFGVDAADVLVLDPKTRTFECVMAHGFNKAEGRSLLIADPLIHQVNLSRQIVQISDLPQVYGNAWKDSAIAQEQFVSYYALPIIIKDQSRGILEIFNRTPYSLPSTRMAFLETLTLQIAIAIENATLAQASQQSDAMTATIIDALVEAWARSIELREGEVEGHTLRVAEMAVRLARAMGMSDEELVHVRRGALLHDVGKMGVPDSILFKPGSLTDEEKTIMRKHPLHAYNLLASIPYLRSALEIPYCHHERWDGKGYPHGLGGETIPLSARVFAVVDVWDALRSNRVFRQAWSDTQVLKRIRNLSGTVFDPAVVDKFLEILEKNAN